MPLQEWQYEGEFPPQSIVNEKGELKLAEEPIENLIIWIYEDGSFVPCAKIAGEEQYSIVADYLGTPTHAFDNNGKKFGSGNWIATVQCGKRQTSKG